MHVYASPNHSIDRTAHALSEWSSQASESVLPVATLLPRLSVISVRYAASRA